MRWGQKAPGIHAHTLVPASWVIDTGCLAGDSTMMKGIRVHGSGKTQESWLHLDWLLRAAAWPLDCCWWYLDGAGCRLDLPELPKFFRQGNRNDPQMKKWHEEDELIRLEHNMWVDSEAAYRVGLPGWFSRYGGAIDGDWALYFAVDHGDGQLPRPILDRVHQMHSRCDWFDDISAWPLPREVCLVARCIDDAYWDLFFRDAAMLGAVHADLSRRNAVIVKPFEMIANTAGEPKKKGGTQPAPRRPHGGK